MAITWYLFCKIAIYAHFILVSFYMAVFIPALRVRWLLGVYLPAILLWSNTIVVKTVQLDSMSITLNNISVIMSCFVAIFLRDTIHFTLILTTLSSYLACYYSYRAFTTEFLPIYSSIPNLFPPWNRTIEHCTRNHRNYCNSQDIVLYLICFRLLLLCSMKRLGCMH